MTNNTNNNFIYPVSVKIRKINNQNAVKQVTKYDKLNIEVKNLRSEMNIIQSELKNMQKTMEEIQYFIGMKHKKFNSSPSYFY